MIRRVCAKSAMSESLKLRSLERARGFAAGLEKTQGSRGIAAASRLLYTVAASGRSPTSSAERPGHVAEWLRSGLQNRLRRFNSGRGLQQLYQYLRRVPSQRAAGRFCPARDSVGTLPPRHRKLSLESLIGTILPVFGKSFPFSFQGTFSLSY